MSLDFPYPEKLEVWVRVCNHQPDLANFLVQIAETIVETKTSTAPCPIEISSDVLNFGAKAGIIVLENDQVMFQTTADFLFFNAKRLVDTEVISLRDNSEKLCEALLKLDTEYVLFSPLQHQGSMVLVLAFHLYNFDVLKTIVTYVNNSDEQNIWGVIQIARNVIPFIDGNAVGLKRFLEEVYPRIQGDWGAGDVHNAIEQLAINQPDFALTFVTILIEEPDSAVSEFISPLIVGLSISRGVRTTYRLGIKLIKEKHVALIRSGVLALSCFNYNSETEDLLSDTITAYGSLLQSESRVEVLSEFTRGIGNLLRFSGDAVRMFEEISGNRLPEVQYVVSEILFRYSREFLDNQWYTSALMNLCGVELKHKGIIKNIDFILSTVVDINPAFVRRFIEAWVDKHPTPNATDALTEIFEALFYKILSKNSALRDTCTTEWLNANDSRFHFHMHYISRYAELHGVILSHSVHTLDEMSKKDILFVLYKTLGYISQINNMCSLAFGLLNKEKIDSDVKDMVFTAFDSYIAYSYPGSSRKFLAQKLENGTDVEKEVAGAILRRMDGYDKAIRQLPRINEFRPPENRVTKYQIRKQRHMSEVINGEVDEKSVFLKLVHKVTLKGGRSTFNSVNGKTFEKMPLVEQSVGMEIPRGALLDPVGDAILRYNWRVYVREGD